MKPFIVGFIALNKGVRNDGNALPRHKAKRGVRKSKGAGSSRIPERVSIHERPPSIDG